MESLAGEKVEMFDTNIDQNTNMNTDKYYTLQELQIANAAPCHS